MGEGQRYKGYSMATVDSAVPIGEDPTPFDETAPRRRDFLNIAAVAAAGVGGVVAIVPLINQMNPDAGTLALAEIEVDVSQVAEGQSITAKWRGKPVFIRQRTAKEVEDGKNVTMADLKDPVSRNANLPSDADASDANRAAAGKEQWLVMVGVCTHLGCIPQGIVASENRGQYGGYFCPCHGSQYDTAARIRKGPAPTNLAVPEYAFTTPTTVTVG